MGRRARSPPTASATQTKSIARCEAKMATAKGPENSIAVETPRGTVRSEA